ncbi:glycosyltransferase [Legionella oakridgensis ATCC 33761 = DSM 21215]|uniref:Glycosyltransferase n=1 Tax=Legionella oakridgensis ATCC 33761 = DSM 21215 TaxID=1268635 RepID=W0BAJ4_9GAMM|nr:glycosyltransferase [Legionella oakridgensis]AHE65642.1 glycosyltransferase [Legionella oakridgensis ATCC 33761 = DSM 21215]
MISEPLFLCLNYDANCLNIPLDNWEMFLEENNPDFILIESSWKVSAQGWNLQINSIGPNSLLSKLIYQCRRKNYPIVFWYTIDPIHIPLFVKTAQLCDKVYAADKKSQQQLENKLSGIPVGHLAIAVQPAIHNPYIIDTWTKKKKITPNFSFLFDGWADVIEFTEILTPQLLPLCKTGLHIVDSKFKYNTNVFNYTPELNIHIMGSMSYLEFISALKSYPILLQPDPTLSSSIARARASLEAICCGASVLTNDISYIVLNEIKLPRMALFETNKRAFSSDALKLLEDKNERSKAVHVARREIMKSHTYMHRLETICCDLHISTNWNKFPLASVILASKRPNYIEKFIETYEKQTYPNKELIITLNKNDIIAAEKINNYIKDKNNVKLLILHQENNIGTCLNTAIKEANGELWFKMDDDDFYGEHYLTDMVLAWQSTEIDVFGKPLSYVYFEEENATYQMSGSRFRNIINCQRYPCGATIAGTKK